MNAEGAEGVTTNFAEVTYSLFFVLESVCHPWWVRFVCPRSSPLVGGSDITTPGTPGFATRLPVLRSCGRRGGYLPFRSCGPGGGFPPSARIEAFGRPRR